MADIKSTGASPVSTAKTATHATVQTAKPKKGSNLLATLAVPICLIIGFLFWKIVLGNPANFAPGSLSTPEPKSLNYFGTMYTGGFIVPILLCLLLLVITFFVERLFTISKAKGKIKPTEFLRRVQYNLANKNVDSAIAECDKQMGSVGNVMRAGLKVYKEMANNAELTTEQKIINIQSEIEQATTLELPILEKNLVFLSTIASCATLMGLLGTVLGMIRAFTALSATGGTDSTALALGIAEALVNTALGIATAFLAIIFYNYFTTQIDGITYGIDETGYTLTQSFAVHYK
ncbi:MAG: MotA/TolQ/ExbB proton channel family protein [Chitinophagaceae bacterium]|jgi:biopolymer transport protein ExbB|nr:MAG: MotA/TolQ/ExbB proton channel family protein [Chitinophagaceae bacterium]